MTMSLTYDIDPVTRYVHVSYHVPASTSDEITVQCSVCLGSAGDWRPAGIWPYVSESALSLMPQEDWENGILRGTILERRAADLVRTVVWNPLLLFKGKNRVRFRVRLLDGAEELACDEIDIPLDNSDVVVLDDWSKVLQQASVSEDPPPGNAVWWLRVGQEGDIAPSQGTSLEVKEKGVELPQLTYPSDLKGPYAIFVLLPPKLGCIELRLSGDVRTQRFTEHRVGRETFWRWTDMTRQHLIIKQPYSTVYEYEDEYRAHLDTVRLVPLTQEQVEALDDKWRSDGEKRIVVGYNEPYSWAFYGKIESNLQHLEPLKAFAQARVDAIDIQVGRGGCRMVFESRTGSQLVADTMGDPVRGKVPRTSNVGRMQQYTNTLATQLTFARLLGMKPRANIGATNCYVGTPLESDFSKAHPEWRIGGQLKYEVPQVREFILALFEETLQIGAEAISIDWCRYPGSVQSKETVTGFFRELRALADRYGKERDVYIDILTRFPARGVPAWEYMDYATWVKEGLVDFLCPSNIQARHLTFELAEYVEAAKGTKVKVLPCADALGWGLAKPGMWLQRILECYEKGADGVYIYQCDAAVLGSPETRRYVSLVGSLDALRRWREREASQQPRYTKGIYINPPNRDGKYQPWGRLRIWIEGLEPETVRIWVDKELMNVYTAPPYVLTSEERSDDDTIPSGKHVLKVHAERGDDWLEREFEVTFA